LRASVGATNMLGEGCVMFLCCFVAWVSGGLGMNVYVFCF